MSLIANTFPIKVLVKEQLYDKPKEALMYSIHHDVENNPFATCWLIDSKVWLVTNLGFVEPIIQVTNNKTIIKETINDGK